MFTRADMNHEHSSTDAENLYHNDYHDTNDFHVHMRTYPAEVSLKYVLYFQAIILLYFLIVMIHFLFFCGAKPRIDNSLRSMRCARAKYCGIWLIIVAFMIVLEISSFYVAYTISDYNKYWLSVLRENSKSYTCTGESLWINVNILLARQEASQMSQNIFGV